jgi:hypothetical protein
MPMSIEEALGTLIRSANPYTTGASGTMAFAAAHPADHSIDPTNIPVEEDNYSAQWVFKGQTQSIEKAIRIQYTYTKTDKDGRDLGYSVTEHLLVGFAGSGGGC